MKIDLTWKNRNASDTGINIYRSTAPFDRSNLPAVLASLPRTALTYSDTTVVRNTLYYYRIENVNANDSALSQQMAILAQAYTGPGPQTLLRGNSALGYYGELTAAQLFTGDVLASLCGVTAGSVMAAATVTWLKFAYKGKILFMARTSIRDSVSWNDLYLAGVVFGAKAVTNAVLPAALQNNFVAQNKIVTKDSDNFIVRLPNGAPSNTVAIANNAIPGTSPVKYYSPGFQDSEYSDLLLRSLTLVPPEQIGQNFDNFKDYQLYDPGIASAGPTGTPTGLTLCQELSPGSNQVLARGARFNASDGNTQPVMCSAIGYNVNNLYVGLAGGACYGGWRPVLELVLS